MSELLPEEIQEKIAIFKSELRYLEDKNDITRMLRQILDATDNTISVADATLPDLPLIYVNKEFEKLTGYKLNEIIGKNCRFLQQNDPRQPDIDVLRHALKHGISARVELRNYRKNGEMFWNELYLTPVHDKHGNLIYFFGVQNDITRFKELVELERKRAFILTVTEQRERRRVAMRLHDELQQQLYATQFALNHLQNQVLHKNNTSPELFQEVKAQLATAIQTTRDVTRSLDTPLLKNDGLVSSLRWLAKNAKVQYDLNVAVTAERDLVVQSDTLRSLLLAIVRELLQNVFKHANTSNAWLNVEHNDQQGLTIEVRDDGSGLDMRILDEPNDNDGNLLSIKHKLELLGGFLEVTSDASLGTCIKLRVPPSKYQLVTDV